MPPPSPAPGTAREWLDRANGKLALAKLPLPTGAFWEDLSFLAQQAAGLGIKAVYQIHGWIFPFVHNLGVLLDGLESHGLIIPKADQEADQLSIFAVQARHPGSSAPVTQAEFEESLRIAEKVVARSKTFLPETN